ncbi:hypothetical protein ACJRO7_014552 [Eucalyptus globulus]|uniref:Beta-1,3-N-Acetylglucosaminyltransferase family protein n=1 Tax=Eucalyptus globulus TaxID=34317 RepID=A0ABD3L6H7_EUCGL
MATTLKILIPAFVMLLVGKGNCQYSPQDIEIVQSQTGAIVQRKPEWNVTINKNCHCTILNASLVCPGFQTVEPIDPSVLYIQGDGCLLNGGQAITQAISFSYAWDDSYPFKIDPGFTVACS